MKAIIDEDGNIYNTLKEACRKKGISDNGNKYDKLSRYGFVQTQAGMLRTCIVDDISGSLKDVFQPLQDDTLDKLRERYSDREIEMILKGHGIDDRRIPFPQITLQGERHHVLVMSDTHIGSIYAPDELIDKVAEYANADPTIECILHCGDLCEGVKAGRLGTQMYELSHIGFEAQKDKAVEMLSKFSQPIYIISGNHDMFFEEVAGANIVRNVADALPNATYIGHDTADIIVGGARIRLFHGGDGSNSYALSYRLQKVAEAESFNNPPAAIFAGHVHKFDFFHEPGRDMWCCSVPCLQLQTPWMRGKKLAAHVGFLDVTFETDGGRISSMAIKYIRFKA